MTYKEYIESVKNDWNGKKVNFDGREYTVVDVDYNGMLIIDKEAEFTNTTAVSVNDVKIIDDVIVDEDQTEEEPETEEGSETMKVKNVLATVWPTNKVNIAVYSNGLKVYDTWDEGIREARECHDIAPKYLNANVAEIFAARDTAAEDEYKNAMAVLCIRADI